VSLHNFVGSALQELTNSSLTVAVIKKKYDHKADTKVYFLYPYLNNHLKKTGIYLFALKAILKD
jgi:hypothetical protein